MALTLIYQMFAKLLDWMVLRIRSDTANDIEILVLRHGEFSTPITGDRWARST